MEIQHTTQPQPKQPTFVAPSVATGGGSISRAEFEELGTEEVIKYLVTQKVVLDADEQAIFRKNKINGDALTGMSVELLVSCQVPMGVAAQIMKRIPK